MQKHRDLHGPAELRGAWGKQKGAQDTGQRVDGTTGNTKSGSVAGSGAQPLLDNDNNNNDNNNDNDNIYIYIYT